jgi:hypothetical protein
MTVIAQTAQFSGVTPDRLHAAYLSAQEHSAMTAGARPAAFVRPGGGEVAAGAVGDELRAFGEEMPSGELAYALRARLLHVVPGRLIVLSWKSKVWDLAIDASDITDLASTVVLTFAANFAGAEVRLDHVNVPNYKVRVPDTGEVGPARRDREPHWSLLYWDPMREYFKPGGAGA